MNKFLGLLVSTLLFCSACATTTQYTYDYVPTEVKPEFALLDQRPVHEKQGKILSLSIMSDQYGIYRLGDDQVIPGRIQYLQEQLQNQVGNLLTSKKIVVESFSIHNDIHKPLKRSAISGALLGPVAALSASEGDAAVTVKLHLSIDSNMISAISESRYVADIHNPDYEEIQLPVNIKKAMDLAIADIAGKLKNTGQLSSIDY